MNPIEYTLIKSKRKTVSIRIRDNGQVEVRAPKYMSKRAIEELIVQKWEWIEAAQKEALNRADKLSKIEKLNEKEVEVIRKKARQIIVPLVEYYADQMGVSYERIAIRTQKSRWGSCSGRKNLNFNALLIMTPEDVVHYVVVHELCHLKEMNHSERFWNEVERVHPSYREDRKWLQEHGDELISMLP